VDNRIYAEDWNLLVTQ